MLAEIESVIDPMASDAHIELETPLAAIEATIVVDRCRLRTILRSFVSKALEHATRGVKITFRTTLASDAVRISVANGRLSLREDERSEPAALQRTGLETEPSKGMSVGLAVSKRLAEIMGGSVGFQSPAEQGFELWLALPMLAARTDRSFR